MRFSGKKEITFAWYTNVISYVVRHQGQSESCHIHDIAKPLIITGLFVILNVAYTLFV